MKGLIFFVLLFFIIPTINTSLHAKERVDSMSVEKSKVISLVNKAKNYIETYGKERAICEFNKKTGMFSQNSSYVFAVDYNGIWLATINYPNLVGTNQINLKDSSGNYLVREEIEKAKLGGGWIKDRQKKNPTTGKMECKASYLIPMPGNYFIGSGFYYPADKQGNCR